MSFLKRLFGGGAKSELPSTPQSSQPATLLPSPKAAPPPTSSSPPPQEAGESNKYTEETWFEVEKYTEDAGQWLRESSHPTVDDAIRTVQEKRKFWSRLGGRENCPEFRLAEIKRDVRGGKTWREVPVP